MIAHPPVAQDCPRRHDEFGLPVAASYSKHIVRHADRRSDCDTADELNHDMLGLLRHLILGVFRQIEHHAAIPFVASDSYRNWYHAIGEQRLNRDSPQYDRNHNSRQPERRATPSMRVLFALGEIRSRRPSANPHAAYHHSKLASSRSISD
jgi:hypothetical protein